MRIRDWSSDVCSSDLDEERQRGQGPRRRCGPDRRRHGVADRPAGEQLHADQRDAQQRQPDPYAAAEQKEQHAEEDQGEKKLVHVPPPYSPTTSSGCAACASTPPSSGAPSATEIRRSASATASRTAPTAMTVRGIHSGGAAENGRAHGRNIE